MAPDHPSAILVVGPSWVGDMVMAQTLFSELRRQHPDCAIDVLAPAWCRPLLSRMPEVREALSLPFDHGDLRLGERRALGRSLRGRYQQAYVLPNSLKSAIVPLSARIPVRTGWRGEMRYGLLNDVRKLDKQRYPLMVQRFVALALPPRAPVPLLESISAPHLQVSDDSRAQAMKAHQLDTGRPVLGLCPGAEFGPAKRWPEHHYAAVARHWIEQGGQVWIFGSGKDVPVADTIVAELGELGEQARVLAGATSLEQAVDLLSATTAVVSNDSGLMHIAAALKRPLVAVYGSTSPGFTPPLGDRVAVVRLGLECSPCFERECPLGHLNCLRQLPPSRVIDALQQLESADA
ncbi:ADP-heptose LPS heptosyltransferase II [Alcanivorax hongdengensis A-11-3]|uniref:lipopolysaccharide heptosyltransferase II n=1 Tax=Alcanivorax hongdengensis A-11-3 TaxID=1177179 RepID=L0WFG5_9GAMM|nr:lipopolysaccharide heptosyltransferase II [Alcanivorax hongdengensis]EKF75439.1 ADP-heptose LPS heptosyltransferase II [Alcanivorax hongdengensis A-11-3]